MIFQIVHKYKYKIIAINKTFDLAKKAFSLHPEAFEYHSAKVDHLHCAAGLEDNHYILIKVFIAFNQPVFLIK